ncbi:MAG: c-type cytochrome [Candidatus Thiodiazotropha sp. (ex Codakia rugifera)]|nr:c-type cytochrome [Candidatus Thiodiazotropha sp. (ex Codakia rugifera)]
MLIMKLIPVVVVIFFFQVSAVQAEGDPVRGKVLAETDCADCHGDDGLGDYDRPPIAGMDPKTHIKELMNYKTGKRKDENEDMVVDDLSEQDMADVAAYYASLPPPPQKE